MNMKNNQYFFFLIDLMAENINKIYCRFVTGMTVEVQLRP